MSWDGGKCCALKWSTSQVFHEIDLIAIAGANQMASNTRTTTELDLYVIQTDIKRFAHHERRV